MFLKLYSPLFCLLFLMAAVTSSATTPSNWAMNEQSTSLNSDTVRLHASYESGAPIDVREVKVRVENFNNVISFQFALQWDADVLELLEVVDNKVIGESTIRTAGDSLVGLVWFDPIVQGMTVEDSTILYVLRFRLIGDVGTFSAIDFVPPPSTPPVPIEITQSPSTNLPFEMNSGRILIESPIVVSTNEIAAASKLQFKQVYPNPFIEETTLEFELAKAGEIQLEIFDVNGRKIREQQYLFSSGTQNITIHKSEMPAVGTYWFRMTYDEFVFSDKMILVK